MEKFKPDKYLYPNLKRGETISRIIIFLLVTYIFNILPILKILTITS